MYQWTNADQGCFALVHGGQYVLDAYAAAQHADGRRIDTREASLCSECREGQRMVLRFAGDNGLILEEYLDIEDGVPTARCALRDASGAPVVTSRLTPLVLRDSRREPEGKLGLWKSLWTRMLTVPYDNTMWLRFEALPLRAGRVSYDLTVLTDGQSREGLLVGALDFADWKNALVCSAYDARTLEAVSGWADGGSHDTMPHGSLCGEAVSSSAFCVMHGEDWRDLLERYGDMIHARQGGLAWPEGSPFGYNSWAGLAARLNEDSFRHTAAFLREELRPAGFENEGVSYVNLDAMWQPIGEAGLKRLRDEQHAQGQRAGIYDAPFAFFGRDVKAEIPGQPGHCFEEILLRDDQGRLLPRVDGAIPMDVTHPLWEAYTRDKYDRFIAWGYEYVKVDFMSHGGMEGVHADASVRTGRQAINRGYRFLAELLSPERAGRPFFISLSIAPMFPCGWGHARRFSCDAFGTAEDVEYVLNAQTYGWWQNRRLYAFNDPDHIVLLRAFCMERDSTEGEARARYTTAVIAGGVMMLSDDYDRPEAMARARMLATNREVNAVARARADFRPTDMAGASACRAYTARIGGREYLALFALREGEEVRVDCRREGIAQGRWRDLWTGRVCCADQGVITWRSEGCDALLLTAESI